MPTSNEDEIEEVVEFFASAESVYEYYNLKRIIFKGRSKKSDHGFECFEDQTFDIYSLSNSFRTSKEQLAKWIYAFQERIYRQMGSDEMYSIQWQNKPDKKGNCTEIQI